MQTIEGNTEIFITDQLSCCFNGGRYLQYIASLAVILFVLFSAIEFTLGNGELGWVAKVTLFTLAMMAALTAALTAIGFYRLSGPQRCVHWKISQEAIETKDETEAAIVLPWGQVKRVRESAAGFRFFCRPAGVRWIPKRAFDEADIITLRSVIAEKTSVKH